MCKVHRPPLFQYFPPSHCYVLFPNLLEKVIQESTIEGELSLIFVSTYSCPASMSCSDLLDMYTHAHFIVNDIHI